MILIVGGIGDHRQRTLSDPAGAFDRPRPVSRFLQGGQQHSRQNGDDRNNDQKFYQRKAEPRFSLQI